MPARKKQSFVQRTRELEDMVQGRLRGSVVVDQVYAQYQHERLDLRHPRGGNALYLQQPLFDNRNRYLQNVADTVLKDGGRNGMIKAMEHLSKQVEKQAPVEFGDLRHSGHPMVREGREITYDRPPLVKRLSEAALRAKANTRRSYDIE